MPHLKSCHTKVIIWHHSPPAASVTKQQLLVSISLFNTDKSMTAPRQPYKAKRQMNAIQGRATAMT